MAVNGLKQCKYNAGIDIGGTKVNIGIFHKTGAIVDKVKIASQQSEDIETFIDRVGSELKRLAQKCSIHIDEIDFIGIGVPGTVDMRHGIVEYCPNLFWDMIPLKEYFQTIFLKQEIMVIQDSWAGALAEHEFGAGIGYADMACITLGTGIGGGIIVNNRIFAGAMHCAGEIGHIIIEKDGRSCNCGNRGCLEKYASGNGIYDQAMELFPERLEGMRDGAESVFELAYQGYEPALELIEQSVQMLAMGLANLVGILSTEAIIISGGLCEHEELILKPLQKYILEYGYHSWTRQNRLAVKQAKLGSDAPMIGAAFLYKGTGI